MTNKLDQSILTKLNFYVLDKAINIVIFALFILPFLIPYGYFPVSKFCSEVLILILSLILWLLSVYKAKRINISSAGIACFIFMLFLLLQIVVVQIRFPGINIAIAIEFAIGGLVSVGIVSLIAGDENEQKKLIQILSWAILIGVTIQAIYGLLQFTGVAENFKDYILYVGTGEDKVFGNIGQKNDYVDFISIGVFALAYLYFINQINLLVFIIYGLFFGVIITFTTSRTPFTFFIFALCATAFFMWNNRTNIAMKAKNKKVLLIIVAMFVGLLILEAALPKFLELFSTSHEDATSGLYRFSTSAIGQSTYRRFFEWYKDIVLFVQHPIFGVGWYQYPREGIYLMNTEQFMYIPANTALYTHSHNTPLNILAETGIIGFVITMIYGFAYSLYKIFKNFNNYATLFVSFMLLTIFAQSCFQYPLWYAYFLIFFILFLSLDKPIYGIKNSKLIKGIATFIFIGFLAFFSINYQTYNQVLSYTQVPQDADDFSINIHQLQHIVDTNTLWSLSALMVLDNYISPTTPQTNAAMSIQDQLRYIDMLSNELPYTGTMLKQIVIHKIVGDNEGALGYTITLAHAYPALKEQVAQQLTNNPSFADDVAVINNFKYEDRSFFAKKFHRKGDIQ